VRSFEDKYPFGYGEAKTSVTAFLKQYRNDIAALPVPDAAGAGTYLNSLNAGVQRTAVTLLPLAAAIKHRRPELGISELFEEVKKYGVNVIDRVLTVR
jgi:hypothetical protein